MNDIKIPSTFRLLGEKYDVVYNRDSENAGNLGNIDNSINVITIQRVNHGKELPETKQVGTFFHELVHGILDSGGFYELCGNEQLVQTVGGLFLQFLQTAEYEDEVPF